MIGRFLKQVRITKLLHLKLNKNCKFVQVKIKVMSTATVKESKVSSVTIVKKMRDYSKESVFKKKAENAAAFIKKNGLPSFKK